MQGPREDDMRGEYGDNIGASERCPEFPCQEADELQGLCWVFTRGWISGMSWPGDKSYFSRFYSTGTMTSGENGLFLMSLQILHHLEIDSHLGGHLGEYNRLQPTCSCPHPCFPNSSVSLSSLSKILFSTFFVQGGKLRPREGKGLAYSHTTCRGRNKTSSQQFFHPITLLPYSCTSILSQFIPNVTEGNEENSHRLEACNVMHCTRS